MIIETLGVIVGASTLGLGALFVAAELAARASLRRRQAWFVHQPHSRYEYRIATDVLPNIPDLATFEANADGERGGAVPSDPEGSLRVLIAGGSAAECYLLDQETAWPMVVQRSLGQDTTRPVHVGNIARSLIPCRTIDPLLARVLPHFRSLDVVVLMVGASDMVDWFEARTPSELSSAPVDVARYCAEHPQGPFGWTPKSTALYRVARRLHVRLTRPVDRRDNAGASIAKHREMRANARVMLDEIPDPRPMLDGFEQHLAALVRTCREHARHVIIARQPWLDREFTEAEAARLWNFGQGSPYRGALDTYYTHRLVRDLMGQVDAVAALVAEALDAPAIDLRVAVPSDFDHYYDFLHFTPRGAERVGEAVAACIRDLPPSEGELSRT